MSKTAKKENSALRDLLAVFSLVLLFSDPLFPAMRQIGLTKFIATPDPLFWLGAVYLAAYVLHRYLPLAEVEKTGKSLVKQASTVLVIVLPVSIAGLMVINKHVFHEFLNSADEFSCFFLAKCLQMGKWMVRPHPLSEFFNVVHVGNRDGKWFSVYPFGWPAIYAIGLHFKIEDWLNPVLSTASLALFYLSIKRIFDKSTALLGVLLIVITPFYAFTSATYFSHSTCLFLTAVFLYAWTRWRESVLQSSPNAFVGDPFMAFKNGFPIKTFGNDRKKREKNKMFWAGIAALALGYGLNTRY